MMKIKILSSLSKVFPDEICNECEISELTSLKNEYTSFQLAVMNGSDGEFDVTFDKSIVGVFVQGFVPVGLAAPEGRDDYFIRNAESGDYPDVLMPFDGKLTLKKNEWTALWCMFNPEKSLEIGKYDVKISIGETEISLPCEVLNASTGEQKLTCTHWFHTDCLASHYGVEVFSEEYWRIVENFMREAVNHGINMILTPLFTPPLDTEVGGERPTVQLVDVYRHAYSKYSFGFDKLKRWVELADRCCVKYFEMSHLFTQWGAKHAPKIMAETGGGYKRIFGWETNAHSQGYTNFLRQFAPELIKFIDETGIRNRCVFHTSDEPSIKDYFHYRRSAKVMNELFGEFRIIDALSSYAFYKNGLTKHPIPSVEHIESFAGKVDELWTYYCCGPYKNNLPNRFISMPSLRNRILGFIMYKYNVKGFLHWGYNFYFTQHSKGKVDPFKQTDAGGAFSSGDAYVVYPDADGKPLSSLRFEVFYDAIKDYEALVALEKKIGRENVLCVLEAGLEKPLSAENYPKNEKWLISKRNEINRLLAKQV
ncbi:MAG: DUF4091 domain-containing protein [Clostridia bacterium]|nr:DUF4091 domain-containing protein [Clostridia bacterium]